MKKSVKKWPIIGIIILIVLIIICVAGFFILKQTNPSLISGYGADFGKGSVDFGEMGNSNAFKDMKLNPFDNNG